MFNSIGDYAKCERCRLVPGFVLGCAIGYNPGQLSDFANPPAIRFALNLNR
jgi:hypothetical protein